ncbi:MAG: enolase C-terminal domain-like protein [Candidatus Latescibacterota bacterium]
MKITSVEAIPINPPLAARNRGQRVRFAGIDTQTVFRVRTDNGITGYGDCRGHVRLPESQVAGLVDRNPVDLLYASLPTGLTGALYDVVGKHLEVPAYRLMGRKVRERVPVAAWTRPASPEDFAAEVQRAAAEGYRWFKMHTCEHYDVLEQTRAAADVAPPGFRIHYDFNHNRTQHAVLGLVQELERSPVVGVLEDPLDWRDLEGWRQLRARTFLPVLMHVPQLGGGPEILHGCADLYMIGEHGIEVSLRRAFTCADAGVGCVIQLTGGTLCKALAMHLGAVVPQLSHSVNLDDQYAEDVTGGRLEISEGSTPVPERPGLGVEVDEASLQRLAAIPPTVLPRYLTVLHLPGGRRIYTPSMPSVSRLVGFPEGNIRGINLHVWEDDGTPGFAQRYDQAQRTGALWE